MSCLCGFKSLMTDLQNGMILNSDSCKSVSEFLDVVTFAIAV
jgi:hypothetical protein